MAKPTNARVYICENNTWYDFLWADTGDDGSVYFGLTGTGKQVVEQITVGSDFDKDIDRMVFHPYSGPHKISFHSSGKYTLANLIENGSAKNRLIVHGTPLADIKLPIRMMDIIIPVNQLKRTKKRLPNIYIELSAEIRMCTHVCCTVYCMQESTLSTFGEGCTSIIRGAKWESKNAFISGNNAWAFILHDAVDESTKKQYSLVSINGAGTYKSV